MSEEKKYWSKDVEAKWHPPEGFFEQPAEKIARGLKDASKDLAQAMDRLKEVGGWMVGLEGSPEAQPPQRLNLNGGIGLVIGNEGQGLRRLVRDKCDMLMNLPMQGQIDSLNAAVAGSIALFLARQARS